MSKIVSAAGAPPQQMNLDLSKTKGLICTCGNHTFVPVTFLRILPALISPSGKDTLIPLDTYGCNSCGAIPDKMVPPVVAEEAKMPQKSKLTL